MATHTERQAVPVVVPTCPGCGQPAHAAESDDDGYHAACRPALAPAVVRVAKALRALVEALPDATYLTVGAHGSVSIACGSDEGARALAATLDHEVREVGNETSRWLDAGASRHDGIVISIYGPHHKRTQVDQIDESRVTAALARAEAAL